jgi:hypothetical protein
VLHTIEEADWKVLRRLHTLVLERFCERALVEIDRVMHIRGKSAHQRYLGIFKIIEQRDREMAIIFNDPKRSNALTMLARIRSEGLLTEDEFSSLSPETRSAIQLLLGAE